MMVDMIDMLLKMMMMMMMMSDDDDDDDDDDLQLSPSSSLNTAGQFQSGSRAPNIVS
jgi:hypothetical protein